ncbi:hypothetical protein PIB30_062640 [Stylosanthes scabra]|uniref:Uncharacterized protein n=1 Tax=Stylosanthes scabra TaxID=79078 RepID=A0ABU6VM73_9FABA|nr:hypothetical protein [Stylosanthes scabra]
MASSPQSMFDYDFPLPNRTVFTILSSLYLNKAKRLPPGSTGLPILGSLHKLGANPHRDLHKLAQKHGPVMYLRLGFVPTIVVSSFQAAELFLKTHDHVFASRPPEEAAKYISWEQRNLSFAEYGPYWRNIRKMCTLELLSPTKINSFKTMRQEEIVLFIKLVREAASDGVLELLLILVPRL